jgi:hypothetical protein
MQNCFLTFNNQRMASIVTTLKAHYCCGLIGEQINNFALTFITPLGAQYHNILSHGLLAQLNFNW